MKNCIHYQKLQLVGAPPLWMEQIQVKLTGMCRTGFSYQRQDENKPCLVSSTILHEDTYPPQTAHLRKILYFFFFSYFNLLQVTTTGTPVPHEGPAGNKAGGYHFPRGNFERENASTEMSRERQILKCLY